MKFFTKKKIIWSVVIILAAAAAIWKIGGGKAVGNDILTDTVKKQSLKQTVLATGQVVSGTDLSLGFKANGIVQKVIVKEGDQVKAGTILAQLEQRDQLASLTTARGSLAQAQASYQKVLAGASNEDVAVTQRAVDAADVALENTKKSLEVVKQQQTVLTSNAYKALLNSTFLAVPGSGNTGSVTATISGTYTGSEQGQYVVKIYSSGGGLRFRVDGLETVDGVVDTTPQPMGSKGLFLQFSDRSVPTNNTWTVAIPNTQASNYVANYNAYQAALETQRSAVEAAEAAVRTAEVSLTQQQAALNLKKAQARPADIAAAQAQIVSAQGQVQSAESTLENTIIRAPTDGTITSVDIRVGEQSASLSPVIVLQDVNNLHVEANVSEANIASLKPGQIVDLTFDALGPDRHFAAVVQTVNPASTVVSGVVNYKVIVSMESLEEVKPGMTANMEVLVAEKAGVLTVPSRAVINRDGKKFIRVMEDSKKKTYGEVEVVTGLEGDGGMVEISSGLKEGQEVVTFIKK